MSESTTLQTIVRTPLAEMLGASVDPKNLATWQSVLTPRVLDDEKAELASLLHGAGLHDLGWLRRISATGADRQRWLSGMVTNAIPEVGQGNYSFILSAQGKIQGDLHAWQEKDAFLLETTAAQVDRIIVHLERYIIMDDVELKSITGETALGLTGPKAASVLASLGADVSALEPLSATEIQLSGTQVRVERTYGVLVPHFTLWFSTEKLSAIWQAVNASGAVPCGLAAWNALRVLEGIPAYGVDLGDKELPQESSQTRALNFSKGCYIGQEIVERIRSRGNVHRNLKQFRLTGELPAAEVELRQGETAVGQLTSVVSIPQKEGELLLALGIVRNEALVRKAPIEYPSGTAEVLEIPPAVNLQD